MPLRVTTKRIIGVAIASVTILLAGGFAFVSYFMHAVYEPETMVTPHAIPRAVRESFAKQFPDAADVAWEIEDGLYEAEFRWQGRTGVEAHFTRDGTWSKTVLPITLADFPPKARDYLKLQTGYEASDPEQIVLPGKTPTYEAKLASKLLEWSCLFDADGNLISRERDGPILEGETTAQTNK